jgi:hypothetical protein
MPIRNSILDGRRLFLLLVLGCSPAAGWSQVTGQVVDSVTGQPIARALVQVGENATLTDHEGHFSLPVVVTQTPIASKPGYFAAPADQPAEDGSLRLPLTPEAILYGTATDANGQPIQHLQVQLRQRLVRAGLFHWQQLQATMTNAEGEFRFAELPAGQYSLATGFLVDGLPGADSSLAFVPMVYPVPDGNDLEAAVTLRAGNHVEANLSPGTDKLHPVSGVISGSFPRGVGFSVETRDGLPLNPGLRFSPESGVFRMLLPSGTYRVHLQGQVENRQFAGAREISVGAAGLEGVSIGLAPLPSIPVEMEYQQSNRQPGQAASPGFFSLTLADEDSSSAAVVLPAQPVNEGNGRPYEPGDPLLIRNIPPGHYVLQAPGQPPWYIASASCGNLDLTRELLVVSSGSGACSMRVVLRDDAASLKWSVAHRGNLVVMAFPLGDLIRDVGGANNGFSSEGSPITGTMNGLAPGRYLVVAATHSLDVPYRDPQALQKYLAWGKEVTLAPGGEAEIELEMAPEEP